jgi:hypothetical protein
MARSCRPTKPCRRSKACIAWHITNISGGEGELKDGGYGLWDTRLPVP